MAEQLYQQGKVIELEVDGRLAFVVEPARAVDGQRRWLWFTSCWHALPRWVFVGRSGEGQDEIATHRFYVEKALAAGFHVVGVDVGVTLGSAAGTEACQRFYEAVVGEHDLHNKARLIAQSNGGLIMYNWAATHPQCVDRIFGIFPVMDLRTWPGLEKVASDEMITHPQLRHAMSLAKLEERLSEFNPIDRLKPLADAGVKLMHVHGDLDETVPFEANSGELRRRYEALNGQVEIVPVAGVGHDNAPQFCESSDVVAFLLG